MRQAAKIDANQPEIVEALRGVGAEVQSLAAVGQGVPDLLVAFRGEWFVIEVKDGGKVPSKRRLTPDEEKWHARFAKAATVHVVETAEMALAAIGAI